MKRALLRAALDQAEGLERGRGSSAPPRPVASEGPRRADLFRRARMMPRLKAGDRVVRRHRLLKTEGILLRFDGEDDNGGSRAWIRWDHATTLPNPSLEPVDDLDLVR